MNITKRNGEVEVYNNEKISIAIKKSFISTGKDISDSEIAGMVSEVEQFIKENPELRTVEDIQNRVEKCLMAHGHYDEAKNYILFRYQRNEQRQAINYIVWTADDRELADVLHSVAREYRERSYSMVTLQEKFSSFTKPGMSQKDSIDALIKAAVELTTPEAPAWEMISARILSYRSEKKITRLEEELGLKTFYRKVKYMTEEGLYGDYILQNYSEEEINEAATFIDPERNKLLNYSGLDLLLKRYVIKNYSGKVIERVQEMFLGIALHLAMPEKEDRLMWVRRIYDLLSKLEVTMATPTLSNSRKPSHQLSSCFIDTVPDSLDGIYRSLDNFSQVSKFGGGMGMYFGKVRATGGNIRGFKGVAGGVIRWMRLVNDTAVAVDQLGMRQGAVAVYLDVWHKDLPEFLQLRTNNGDDRMKAHDIFPAICYPDLFWKMAEEDMNQNWSLFCPNEIMRIKGYCLEDCYGEEWEHKYLDCVNDQRLSRRVISIKDIVRLVLRSAVETGTPFTFNRDTVNRANPNAHKGMIYCSNLCTEIAQNMAPIETVSKEVETKDGDTVVVTTTRPGEFVVCNLASLSLGRLPLEDEEKMKEKVATVFVHSTTLSTLTSILFLMHSLPTSVIVLLAWVLVVITMLWLSVALKWESEEHLEFMDKVFETINRAAILASSNLAKEKGSYQFFEGSDWQTGIYFDKRGYNSAEWQDVRKTVALQGMRNAYLLAVAPTSSTSIIAGTTAGLDPIMKRFFLEEKKGSMLPRVAPELSDETYWMYKSAYLINQKWSVRASGVRQRHIDQAQSMNLYITNDFTMRQILDLYLLAWKEGVKTIYYVRSKSLEVEECESCSS